MHGSTRDLDFILTLLAAVTWAKIFYCIVDTETIK